MQVLAADLSPLEWDESVPLREELAQWMHEVTGNQVAVTDIASPAGYLPTGTAMVHEPGGLPSGWVWMACLDRDVSLVRTSSGGWMLMNYTGPSVTRRAWMGWGQVYRSLGALAQSVATAEKREWYLVLAGLLVQCRPADEVDRVDNLAAETMLLGLGGTLHIPPCAYHVKVDAEPAVHTLPTA